MAGTKYRRHQPLWRVHRSGQRHGKEVTGKGILPIALLRFFYFQRKIDSHASKSEHPKSLITMEVLLGK
jgi:hypothetical protein